jgi:hypothetical protein
MASSPPSALSTEPTDGQILEGREHEHVESDPHPQPDCARSSGRAEAEADEVACNRHGEQCKHERRDTQGSKEDQARAEENGRAKRMRGQHERHEDDQKKKCEIESLKKHKNRSTAFLIDKVLQITDLFQPQHFECGEADSVLGFNREQDTYVCE